MRTRRGTPRTRPTQSSGGLPGSQVGEPTWRKRSPPQNGLCTLITRSIDGDAFELVGTVSAVHGAAEHDAYLDYLSRPEVAILTITVTEAGYLVAINQSTKR